MGITLALGLSALVAQPAVAANEIDLGLSTGVSYSMVSGETLTVQATAGPTIIAGQYPFVKFSIANAGGLTLTTTYTSANSAGDNDLAASTAATAVVKSTGGNTAPSSTLAIDVGAAEAGTVTVQSWIDTDNDDVIDNNEFSSAVRTLTFVKLADVTWTTVLAQPALGSDDFAADLTTSPVVNYQQIASAVKIGVASVAAGVYTKLDDVEDNAANGATTVTNGGAFTAGITVTGTDSKLSFSDTDVEDNAAAGVYVAQALFDPAGAAIGEVGAESYKTVAAATITGMGEVVATDSTDLDYTSVNAAADTIAVRSTATSVPVTITATGATAAVTISVTITENTVGGNTDAATFTAGGKVLQDTVAGTAQSITFDVVSDAAGKASFTIVSSGALAGDAITVSGTAQGFSSPNATVVTWTTAGVASVANTDVAGTNAVLKAATNANYTLNYAVKDIFGALGTGSGTLRLSVSDGTTTKFVPVTAGVASVTFSNATAGNLTLTAEVQKQHTDGNYYDLLSLPVGAQAADVTTTTTVVIGTSAAATAIALTAAAGAGNNGFGDTAGPVALNANNAQTSADTRLAQKAPTTAGGVAISGTISDATTAGTYSSVTLTGTNLLFSVAQGKYSAGSITVQTNAAGAFSTVTVYSNKAGTQTLTVTAGTVTKTQDLVFAQAADTTGKSLVITAPTLVAPGSTLSIVGTVTDTYGNPINTDGVNTSGNAAADFKITYSGPGLQVGSTPTETDASGQAKLSYFLGSNDSGVITATFYYDANGDADYADTGDLVVKKEITIGVPEANAVIGSFSGRVAVRVENAKGSTISVKIGRSWYKYTAASANYLKSWKSRKGSTQVVTVYVDGDLQNTATITVK